MPPPNLGALYTYNTRDLRRIRQERATARKCTSGFRAGRGGTGHRRNHLPGGLDRAVQAVRARGTPWAQKTRAASS